MHIAILGAQGSGKTQLTQTLQKRFEFTPPASRVTPLLIADGTPLMAAVMADLQFNDPSLYAAALEHHKVYDLTLLLGLDLDWHATGSVPREALDARLRAVLVQNQLAFTVIYGLGPDRVEAALNAIKPLRKERAQPPESGLAHWQSNCEKCSDPVCEHRLFTGRLQLGQR
jgi:nicotinamide riboside kinase